MKGQELRKWDARFAVLILGLFFFRLLYALIVPLDLVPDEAYYWDWSRHLDWGYYSKPPMVAWIIALSTHVFGSTPFGVRLPAVFLGIIGLFALYGLGRRLYGPKAAFWAVLAISAAPGSCALGLLMTIDAPLLCFWSVALYTLWRAIEDRPDRTIWWGITVLTTALGLLTKQTMLAFVPLFFLFLMLSPQGTSWLRRGWTYAFLILPTMALLPVLRWNAQHDWITFRHTSHHFSGVEKGVTLSLFTFFEFVGTQLAVFSPLLWILLAAVCFLSFAPGSGRERRERYLLSFGAVPLAGVLLLSGLQEVNANWPAPFYSAAFILVSAWGIGQIPSVRMLDGRRSLFKPGLAMGAALSLIAYLLPFLLPLSALGGGKIDPTVRLRGWQELGREVGKALSSLPEREKVFLMGVKRQVVSELAFYVPGQPQVYCWPEPDHRIRSQYDLWEGPTGPSGRDALIVAETGRSLPEGLLDGFGKVEPVGEVTVPLGKARNRQFQLYRGYSLKKWP